MPEPKKPAAPTLARRVAALEEKCLDQSIDLALLRDHMDGRLAEQREWFREAIAEAEQRIIGRQGFDRVGTLRREFMDGADFVYKELRRMREQAESFVEGFGLVEAMLAEMAGNMESLGQQVSEIEAERPVLESSRERAERAVEQIQAMLADPRLAPGAPTVAAPAHDPASAFPADGLVEVSMGEIGGKPCPVVDARELHGFIGNKDKFATWIVDRIQQYAFEENQDFMIASANSEAKRGGHNRKDYTISLDMAKELGMVERTPKGREIRRYFIKCEERLREILAGPAQTLPAAPTQPQEALGTSGHMPTAIQPQTVLAGDGSLPFECADDETAVYGFLSSDCPITCFQRGPLTVRGLVRDGRPWFLAQDVATLLGLTWTGATMRSVPREAESLCFLHVPDLGKTLALLSVEGLRGLVRTHKGEMDGIESWIDLHVLPELSLRHTLREPFGGTREPCLLLALALLPEPGTEIRYADRAVLARDRKILAYLLRNAPRQGEGWPLTFAGLAASLETSAPTLKKILQGFEALGYIACKAIGQKGRPGPTLELRMLWENIEAAARRDGADLAALAGAAKPARG